MHETMQRALCGHLSSQLDTLEEAEPGREVEMDRLRSIVSVRRQGADSAAIPLNDFKGALAGHATTCLKLGEMVETIDKLQEDYLKSRMKSRTSADAAFLQASREDMVVTVLRDIAMSQSQMDERVASLKSWEAAEKTQQEESEGSQQMLKKGMAKLEKVNAAVSDAKEKAIVKRHAAATLHARASGDFQAYNAAKSAAIQAAKQRLQQVESAGEADTGPNPYASERAEAKRQVADLENDEAWEHRSPEQMREKAAQLDHEAEQLEAQRDQLIDEGRMVEDALADVRAQNEAAEAEVKRTAETLEKLRRQVDQTKQAESGSLEGIRPNLEERHELWTEWMSHLYGVQLGRHRLESRLEAVNQSLEDEVVARANLRSHIAALRQSLDDFDAQLAYIDG
jgi:chromosome segregation ATPase